MSTFTLDRTLTVSEVDERVGDVAAVSHDSERAHNREDHMRRDVLRAIADGAPDPAALARAALATESIDFERWYA